MKLKKNQNGFAALLAVLLLGLGITAATVGTIFGTQDIQNSNLALHKQAQAQAKVWQAVEVVRLALQSMPTDDLNNLASGNLEITGLDNISAQVTSNVAVGSGRRITVQITAVGSSTNSASTTIEAIYQVTAPSGGGGSSTTSTTSTISNVSAVNIKGNLQLSGYLKVLGGNNAQVNVTGNVDLSGTVLNIVKLCATGDIVIGSGITVDTVCTDGNLTVNAGATVSNAIVKGNVSVTGAGIITTISSNGNVSLSGGSASSNSISAKGSVIISGGSAYATTINSESSVSWTSSSNKARSINANGDVTFAANSPLTNITSGGNVTLNNQGHVNNVTNLGNVTLASGYALGINGTLASAGNLTYLLNTLANAGKVKGVITGTRNAWSPAMNVTSDTALVVAYSPVSVAVINNTFEDTPQVDARLLETSANYAFKIDSNGKKIVVVRNVSNIPDGTYFLADYAQNWEVAPTSPLYGHHVDYLCSALNGDGKCTTPANPSYAICQGFSSSTPCFSYKTSTQKWTISGTTMAAGVAWFEGSLEVSNGTYFNTFAATCDISTGGSMRTYSPNYVGYAGICQNATAYTRTSNALFSNNYPRVFCETTDNPGSLAGSYQAQSIGNVAFVSGSYSNGVFQCGQLGLGASNEVFGSVIAGNNLAVSGSTTVHGQIYSAGQGTGTVMSTTGGGVTIDLTNLPPTFDPIHSPCTVNCQGSGSSPSGSSPGARMFWSKYL